MTRQEFQRYAKEYKLLKQIEFLTDCKKSEKIKSLCNRVKNDCGFDIYLEQLQKVLDALSAGAPVDKILKAIDNYISDNEIDTLILAYRIQAYQGQNLGNYGI